MKTLILSMLFSLLPVSSLICMDESAVFKKPARVKSEEMRQFESKCRDKYREKAVRDTRHTMCWISGYALANAAWLTIVGTYCLHQYLCQPCQPCNYFNITES